MTRAEVPERRRTLLHPGLADLAKEALPGAIRRDLAVEARGRWRASSGRHLVRGGDLFKH
ncbi:MAG: hypothetical protein QOJ04_1738 [Caballeronia sp.]|nr:hypothetical protein [Caballeronia sp.]